MMTNNRIDHAENARSYIDRAGGAAVLAVDAPKVLAALAQAEATLALAEQQRIRNLIALFHHDPEKRTGGAASDFANEAWDHLADTPIRAALGLEGLS